MPLEYLRELVGHWSERYDWRVRERRLNSFPQFRVRIGDLAIHCYHVRSKHAHATPLLMTHGWPGSVVEFLNVLGPLTAPEEHGGTAADAFHVVCPSLPGYAFSDKPSQPGCGVDRIAELWDELMLALGYEQYFAQGGDWGAAITTQIGVQNRGHCRGIHLNLPIAPPPSAVISDPTPAEAAGAGRKPSLCCGRIGLRRPAEHAAANDRLCTGRLSGRAVRLDHREVQDLDGYRAPPGGRHRPRRAARQRHAVLADRERGFRGDGSTGKASARASSLDPPRVTLPTACSLFAKEIARPPRSWVERRYVALKYWNELPKGGHFAAFEQPALFVDELRRGFRALR